MKRNTFLALLCSKFALKIILSLLSPSLLRLYYIIIHLISINLNYKNTFITFLTNCFKLIPSTNTNTHGRACTHVHTHTRTRTHTHTHTQAQVQTYKHTFTKWHSSKMKIFNYALLDFFGFETQTTNILPLINKICSISVLQLY